MKKVLITTLLTIIIIAQTSVAQRIYNPANGHLYEKFDTPMTWNDAKAYCESVGGYLATVTSQEEQDWIWSNLEPLDCYFGASDIEEEGVWKWVTGEPWDYTNWAPGQPDNNFDGEHVIHWLTSDGLWNDISGSHARIFVCEYEPSNEVFVSPNGSDETGDGSAENPYRTIQHGIDMSPRKDAVVRVLPGTYQENITLSSDLMVLGSGAAQTIITAAGGNVVSATNVVEVTLAGFTIDGQGAASNGILCSGATAMMMINDNIITRATTGIRCSDSANVLIQSNTIRQHVEVGVYCDDSANVDVKNNTIEQNGREGILCGGSAYATISNNTISQNGGNGVSCWSTNVTIDDNNLEDNEEHGVACNGDAKVSIINNNIRRNNYDGVSSWDTADVTIQYNVMSENNSEGVSCTASSTMTCISNTIQYNCHGLWCTGNAVVNITDNLIHSNQNRGIVLSGSSNTTIIRNIIRDHHGAIDCHESVNVLIGGNLTDANNILDNRGVAIRNWASTTIDATYNYWGATDEKEIAAMMINEGSGSIDFIPFVGDPRIIGDVSGNGTISAYDAALILQFTVGLIDKLPVSMSKSPQYSAPRDYELRLPNLAARPGERLHAPIAISDATGLSYGGVIIKYDPSVLKVIDVAALGMLSGSYWKANTHPYPSKEGTRTGEVRFAFATPLPMEGKGNLLMIDFEALPNTTGRESPLIFDTVEFPEGQNIRAINGSVTILPERTMLLQNYPNPFNPETWIPFQLAQDAVVILRIYNQKGQLVRALSMGAKPAGTYISRDKAAYWDGRDFAGEKVANGVYFYTLYAGDFLATRKLVLMK